MRTELRIKRSVEAISRLVSVMAIIILVAAASFVAYMLLNEPTADVAPRTTKALHIQCMAKNTTSGTLIVYVENVGEETVKLDSECSLYVNDVQIPLLSSAIDKNSLEPGQTATIQVPFIISTDMPVRVKITTYGGTSTESPRTYSNFLPTAYTLTVNTQENGGNCVTKDPDQPSYASGTSVVLTANPQDGWSFEGWSGDLTGSNNPATISIDTNKVVNASFVPANFTQKVQVTFTQFGLNGSATGTILTVNGTAKTSSELPFSLTVNKSDVINYTYADPVSSSISGMQFKLSAVSGPASPITVTSDATVNGNYQMQYKVQFAANPNLANATTDPLGTQLINAGQTVRINATTASDEFVFDCWNASNPSITFADEWASSTNATVNGPGTITANFRILTKTPTKIDWYTQPSNTNLGGTQNITGVLYDSNMDWSTGGLNGKNVSLIVTAPNNTQISVLLTTHSVNSSLNGIFEYQFKPDAGGTWTVSAQFTGDTTYEASVIPPTPFTVSTKPQHQVYFKQNGADGATATLTVTYQIDGGPNQTETVPFSLQVYEGSHISYAYQTSVPGASGTRYLFTNAAPDSPQTVTGPLTITGNYKTQYYLTVNSPAGTNPTGQKWYDAGSTASSSVTSPVTITGPPKISYTAKGYTGTGSAPSGAGTTVKFTINSPSNITWNWNGQLILYPDGDGSNGYPIPKEPTVTGNVFQTSANPTTLPTSMFTPAQATTTTGSLTTIQFKTTAQPQAQSTASQSTSGANAALGQAPPTAKPTSD